ncbi:MAG: DUF2953 domain-containing protein, partial [Clostridia bacterium]|nr:DUF2953 domain-containing protein [Clostridia bacterium]
GLLALILFILFVPVHLIFRFDGGPFVWLRILFIRMDGIKLVRKLTGEKPEKKKKKKEKPIEAPEKQPERKKKKGGVSDFLDFLELILKIVKRAISDLFGHLHINLKELAVRFGLGEADQTALAYGGAIQASNYLFALLERFTHFRYDPRRLAISPDFSGDGNVIRVHLDLWIQPVHLLVLALHALVTYLQGKEQKS